MVYVGECFVVTRDYLRCVANSSKTFSIASVSPVAAVTSDQARYTKPLWPYNVGWTSLKVLEYHFVAGKRFVAHFVVCRSFTDATMPSWSPAGRDNTCHVTSCVVLCCVVLCCSFCLDLFPGDVDAFVDAFVD